MDRSTAAPEESRDRLEQVVRLMLLLILWGLWLLVRGLWALLGELTAAHAKTFLHRVLAWGLLVLVIFLAPHAVGLWWSRLMLADAADLAAARSADRDPVDIETELRRKAFKLGFQDLYDQPEAIRIHREEREAGPFCRIELDFRHRPVVYGWTLPPLRIQVRAEAYVLPGTDWTRPLVHVE